MNVVLLHDKVFQVILYRLGLETNCRSVTCLKNLPVMLNRFFLFILSYILIDQTLSFKIQEDLFTTIMNFFYKYHPNVNLPLFYVNRIFLYT